jgi:iron complex outermembrane receptor protein
MKRLYNGKIRFSHNCRLLLIMAVFCAFGAPDLPAIEITASASSAQEEKSEQAHQIEKMTVTAQKIEEDVQDVPDSISVLGELAIADAGITDMTALAAHVPNLEFYDFGSGWHNQTFMRGIKSLNNAEPATGFYVDGVNYSKSYMFAIPLFDVERIEVLRGPQGTLYGRNTMAGVINIHTRMPDNDTAAGISGSYASYNERQVQGYVRTPVIPDRLFFGLAGQVSDKDGYMENDISGTGEDGRHEESYAGRMKLRFLPTAKWDIAVTLDGQQREGGAFPFRRTKRNAFVKSGMLAVDDAYHYTHNVAGTSENDYWGGALNASVDTAWGTFTAISGYRDYDNEDLIDSDFSPMDAARMKYRITERTFSQELRLASDEDRGSARWLAGLYYFHIDSGKERTNYFDTAMARSPKNPFSPVTGNRMTDIDGVNEGAALFGQFSRSIRETVDLTLGLRYEFENARMDATVTDTPDGGLPSPASSPAMENDFTAWLPKLSLSWHYTGGQMLYATASGAHRSGGFNGPDVGGLPFDEEYSWMYEVGLKSVLLNERLTLNTACFYTDIEDEQITRFNEYNTSYLENAGASHRLGMEVEADYLIFQGLQLDAAFGWVEAEYDRYNDPVTGEDYEGKTIFNVPDYTVTVGLQYRRPLWRQLNGFGRVEVSGVGRRYFDDANTVRVSPYELVNLKLGLEGRHWDGYVWAENLFDRHYRICENVNRGITEDGEPVTVGVSLAYRFQ